MSTENMDAIQNNATELAIKDLEAYLSPFYAGKSAPTNFHRALQTLLISYHDLLRELNHPIPRAQCNLIHEVMCPSCQYEFSVEDDVLEAK